MTDQIDAAVAAAAKPIPAPMFQVNLGLNDGRASVLAFPEDTTDEELMFVMVTIGSQVRAILAQKRIAARPRILRL